MKSVPLSMLAWEELAAAREDMQQKGEETLRSIWKKPAARGIVLAGRPYHIDPEINHGIPDTDQLLRTVRADGGLCFPSGTARASAPCQ
ncbi:MAG: acyl-CoA dehydratase activase-related protein [Fusicatenibacter saccharivorans]